MRELLQTPPMLSIAVFASSGKPMATEAVAPNLEQRRMQRLRTYVAAIVERRQGSARHTEAQTVYWLGWLARAMLRHHQSVFYLEWMQPDWLQHKSQRWLAAAASVVICAIVAGLAVGLSGGLVGQLAFTLRLSLAFGVGGGLVCGLLGYGDEIQPITRLHWP